MRIGYLFIDIILELKNYLLLDKYDYYNKELTLLEANELNKLLIKQ